MATSGKVRTGATWAGIALLAFIGWCAIMIAYLTVYNAFEEHAVPVSFGSTRDFEVERWDYGFFHAKGTYKNDSAVEAGDELSPQVDDISCVKQTNTCTIAVADVYDHFLNLDVSTYDIESWTDKQITFSDSSAICATSNFVIDRGTKSFGLLVEKKAVIPDYALRSPLHPCDHLQNKSITLTDGFPVYWHLLKQYEQRNGIYFHILLVVLNISYFGNLFLWWRRRRARRIVVTTTPE